MYIKKAKSYVAFILISTILIVSLLSSSIVVSYSDEMTTTESSWPVYPNIYADAGIVIEASTGTILYEKNSNNQMYPASITKIMTALLALEKTNPNDIIEFSHYSVYSLEAGAAHVSMDEKELLPFNDCLYAILLASANEVSNAVGEHIARQQPEYTQKIEQLQASGQKYNESVVAIQLFSDMMNARAKECGAINTNFCNPHGLFDENHYTTCYDMAMITREAIKNDQFLKVESQTSYILPTTNLKSETQAIANRHKMLFPLNSVYYEGILGGKTGYVDQSGNTLVTFARRNGMTLISVIMKSNSENVYKDTKLLLDYGFNNFSLSNISQNEVNFTSSNYSLLGDNSSIFSTSSTLIKMNSDDNIVLPNGVNFEQCTSTLNFQEEDNDIFATLEYRFADKSVGSTTLTVNTEKETGFNFGPTVDEEIKKETTNDDYITINIWVVLGVIVVILFIIFVLYYLKSTYVYRKRRRYRRGLNKKRKRIR